MATAESADKGVWTPQQLALRINARYLIEEARERNEECLKALDDEVAARKRCYEESATNNAFMATLVREDDIGSASLLKAQKHYDEEMRKAKAELETAWKLRDAATPRLVATDDLAQYILMMKKSQDCEFRAEVAEEEADACLKAIKHYNKQVDTIYDSTEVHWRRMLSYWERDGSIPQKALDAELDAERQKLKAGLLEVQIHRLLADMRDIVDNPANGLDLNDFSENPIEDFGIYFCRRKN